MARQRNRSRLIQDPCKQCLYILHSPVLQSFSQLNTSLPQAAHSLSLLLLLQHNTPHPRSTLSLSINGAEHSVLLPYPNIVSSMPTVHQAPSQLPNKHHSFAVRVLCTYRQSISSTANHLVHACNQFLLLQCLLH